MPEAQSRLVDELRATSVEALITRLINHVPDKGVQHISRIVFPEYKHMARGTEICFSFPITVLAGPNGANKSSILRALEACGENISLGDSWFETKLDQISKTADGSESRARFFYEYKTKCGQYTAQYIQHRSFRVNNPDYWESTEPRQRDGMAPLPDFAEGKRPPEAAQTRWRKIPTQCLLYDPRLNRSAFDMFLFGDIFDDERGGKKTLARSQKKEIIRSAADDLSRAFDGKKRVRNVLESRMLSEEQVELCGWILGRDYSGISIVKHHLYGPVGWAARISSRNALQYTEAYAGAGELSVILLVDRLLRLEEPTIILLDEPETSLHPMAQKRLLGLLALLCIHRGHQVIISSHSRDIIGPLPAEARKLLSISDVGDSPAEVSLSSQQATASEVYSAIGHSFEKQQIIVEDRMAAALIRRALRVFRRDALRSLEIRELSGSGTMGRFMTDSYQARPHLELDFFIFDGDQRPEQLQCDPWKLQAGTLLEDASMEAIIDSLASVGLATIKGTNMSLCGQRSAPIDEQYLQARRVYSWAFRRVAFLPGCGTPEGAVVQDLVDPSTNPDVTDSFLETVQKVAHTMGDAAFTRTKESKELWRRVAKDYTYTEPNGEEIYRQQLKGVDSLTADSKLLKQIFSSLQRLGLA